MWQRNKNKAKSMQSEKFEYAKIKEKYDKSKTWISIMKAKSF